MKLDIQPKEIISLGNNNKFNRFLKRAFDIIVSFLGLIFTLPIILISALLVRINYKESGFFTQTRVGMNGKKFKIIKIKTMSSKINYATTVTTEKDPRITKLGKIYRKTKIDELPQLINVLKGEMSFVGPRPDVEEIIYSIDKEKRKKFLSIRPGITGPASIKYKNEEEILAKEKKPEIYNKEIIFPDKVDINEIYMKNYSIKNDIKYIMKTIV